VKRFIVVLVAALVLVVMIPPAPAGQIPSHVYVAARYASTMPDPLWGLIAGNRDLYIMGCQGPDIAGLSGEIEGIVTVGKQDYGTEAHYERTGTLALWLLMRARTQREFAFAVGWITHYLNDIHVHAVVNSYGGFYGSGSEAKARHKALEMLETKHIFADPALFSAVSNYDFNRIPANVDRDIQQLLYEAYRDLYGDKYQGSNVRTDFGLYLKVLGDHVRAASRNFLDAHKSGTGIFRVDGAAITHQIFDRLPSSDEYKLIMEGPLTVTSVRAEKDKVVVSLKVNDTKLLGRFVKDCYNYIEASS